MFRFYHIMTDNHLDEPLILIFTSYLKLILSILTFKILIIIILFFILTIFIINKLSNILQISYILLFSYYVDLLLIFIIQKPIKKPKEFYIANICCFLQNLSIFSLNLLT